MVLDRTSGRKTQKNTVPYNYIHVIIYITKILICRYQCNYFLQTNNVMLQSWEFTWSKSFQSLLLSVYYIGCCLSQVPGGWVANRFGGKMVITATLIISCLCTLLTPVLARANGYLVLPLRLIMGLCSVSFVYLYVIMPSMPYTVIFTGVKIDNF